MKERKNNKQKQQYPCIIETTTYPVAAKKANDSFSFCNNWGITNDWTGVGSCRCNSSVKVEHISVNNPNLFHSKDCDVDDEEDFCCLFPVAESSALFFGIRNGARDLDIADRSEDDELDDDEDEMMKMMMMMQQPFY